MQPPTGLTLGFAPRLAAYYAAYFVGIGVQLPFFPLWLAAKGLDARMIGIVLAAPMVVRIVAIPLVTRQADRRNALRAAIIAGSLATALGYGLVGWMDGAVAILTAYVIASVAFTPTMPLVDAYALRGLAQIGRAYGPVRLWGSASFIAGSLGAGAVLGRLPPDRLIWLIAAAYAVTTAIAVWLIPITPGATGTAQRHGAGVLLRSPAFICVALAASLIQASHALLYGFSTIQWQAAGLSGTEVGALWALGVVAEIALFALSGRLPAAVGPTILLIIGAAGAVVRWGAMAFEPPTALLPALQCLHALSFAATHLGAIGYLNRAAPPALAATAQGYLAIALGIGMAAATASSGLLYAGYGHRAYAVMALLAGVGGLFAIAAHRISRIEPPT